MRRFSQLQRDLAANLGARFWSMVLNLAAVPVYLKHLGAEAYGLIGLMVLLENISALMDSGLGMTLNRELARRTAGPASEDPNWVDNRRDFLATLQVVHISLALICGVVVFFAAPAIAEHWVQAKNLTPAMITLCLRWMSLSIAAAVLFSFYQGGLFGVRKQVGVNVLVIVFAALRVGGCMVLLTFFTSSPDAFFATQGITLLLQVIASAILLWASLPKTGRRTRIEFRYIHDVWKFAAIVSANAFLTAAVSQIDKIIFSRALPLEEFGYYTLAGTAVGTLWAVVLPLTAPFFPRFAELWEIQAIDKLSEMYHRASQLVTLAVAPLAAILAAFAYHLLMVWTGNDTAAMHAAPLVIALCVGTAANTLAAVPANIQNAVGWPGLITTYNMVYAVTLLPLVAWVAFRFGAVPAVSLWAIPNIGYLFITTPIMHRRVMRGQLGTWYRADVLGPAAVALVVALICRLAMPPLTGRIPLLAYIAASGALTLLATFIATKNLRVVILQRIGEQLRLRASS
ncbi:MAG TPA: oligosaccharide flippase family protein [Gemmatimonadaceae bacterium]|jgi:O-antigen/teichoic acid export membrane protein